MTLRLAGMLLTLGCACVCGQTISSSMLGTVTDPSSSVVPSAEVQLTDQATGVVRTSKSDSAGLFRFANLSAGSYSLSIRASGFKSRIEKDIALTSSETRDLGRVTLDIGNLSEVVAVTAEATPVQTASSEKGTTIDASQLSKVALKGRDVFGLMRLVPGVIDTANRDVTSPNGLGNISINGNTSAKNFTVDGITAGVEGWLGDAIPPGSGRQGPLDDRGPGHGHAVRQTQDDRGSSEVSVSEPQGPDRH